MHHQTSHRYVAYYRVSTRKQGQSGLGLEAQQQAVQDYLKATNGSVIAEYIEIESGKREDRPEFAKAADYAELANATLLVAKLDRLSRDLHFVTGLQKRGIRFKLCDLPEVDQLTIHILAAMAQHEARMISLRTTQAMQAAKARGTQLGNPILDQVRNRDLKSANSHRLNQQGDWLEKVKRVIEHIKREEGVTTCQGIADELNRRGLKTYRGKRFSVATVSGLMREGR